MFVNVCQALLNQVARGLIHEFKVITGAIQARLLAVLPVKTKPLHRFQNALNKGLVLSLGVGVVQPQVAYPPIGLGQTKVQANALGVSYVQMAVGFRRKTGADGGMVLWRLGVVRGVSRAAGPAAGAVGALRQVGVDQVAQKIGRNGVGGHRGQIVGVRAE